MDCHFSRILSESDKEKSLPIDDELSNLCECDLLHFEHGGWESTWIDDFLISYFDLSIPGVLPQSALRCAHRDREIDEFAISRFDEEGTHTKSRVSSLIKYFFNRNFLSCSSNTGSRESSKFFLNIFSFLRSLSDVKRSKFTRYRILFLSFLIVALTGSSLFNWADLRVLILRNGGFSALCAPEEINVRGSCKRQELALDDTFNVAVVFIKLMGLVTGTGLDILGPKVMGIFGLGFYGSGLILLGLNYIVLGLIFLGCAMNPIFNSVVTTANLVPRHKNLVVCFLSAGGDLCVLNFFILKILSDNLGESVSSRKLFFGYSSIVLVLILIKLCFYPMRKIQVMDFYQDDKLDDCESPDYIQVIEVPKSVLSDIDIESFEENDYKKLNRWKCLKTFEFWIFLPFFCLLYFKKINYLRDVKNHINYLSSDDPIVANEYSIAFSVISCFAAPVSLIIGFGADKIGTSSMILIVNVFSCLYTVFSSISVLQVQILSFITFTIFKCFIISSVYCFVYEFYGSKNLGFLTGLQQVTAGLFCLVNVPFKSNVVKDSFLLNHLILLVPSIVVFLVPIYLLRSPHKSKGIRMDLPCIPKFLQLS